MERKLICQVPNSAPDDKKDDKKDKDKDSHSDKASLKSQGKRRSNPEFELAPGLEPSPMKESGSDRGHASGSKHEHDYAQDGGRWRESKLGKKLRGMENEEDMIKQRAEMRGLIEKKTYIGLVSQLSMKFRIELIRLDSSIRRLYETCSSRRDWTFLL